MRLSASHKSLFALLFLVAFIAQSFSKLFVVADYYTNTAKYAKNCENKKKPILKCNGKCQMMKQLQEQEKQEQENPDKKLDTKIVVLSSKSFFPELPKTKSTALILLYYHFNNLCTYKQPRIVFHPPGELILS